MPGTEQDFLVTQARNLKKSAGKKVLPVGSLGQWRRWQRYRDQGRSTGLGSVLSEAREADRQL